MFGIPDKSEIFSKNSHPLKFIDVTFGVRQKHDIGNYQKITNLKIKNNLCSENKNFIRNNNR